MRRLEGAAYKGREVVYNIEGDSVFFYYADKSTVPFHTITIERATNFAILYVHVVEGDRQSYLVSDRNRNELAQYKGIPDRLTFDGEGYFIKKGRICQGSYDPGPESSSWKTVEELKLYKAMLLDLKDVLKARNKGKGSSERPLVEDKETISGGFLTGREADKLRLQSIPSDTVYKPSGVTVGELMEGKRMLATDV